MANIVNIVNFVRGKEPRDRSLDLTKTIREEIKLNKKYGFKNTVLLQYDALNQPEFQPLIDEANDGNTEFGFWFEVVQPLCEAVGIKWRGRPGFEWDWHVCPGFLMSYDEGEKRLLIDEAMENFKSHFGNYPYSVGSWLLDSFSIAYMHEKYGVCGFAICREQWGTDGYTLWGGYYNGAYYPSKENAFTPAQTKEYRIDAPVFRLLGADPIHCYYEKSPIKKLNRTGLNLHTLEPYWNCGKDENWVDWYFGTTFACENMGFGYTQVGQENSFRFEPMKDSLPMQYEYLANALKARFVEVKTLGETAKLFRETYEDTPATAITSLRDWHESNCQSVWYDCKNYRLNLFRADGIIRIRDIHKFDETYRDKLLDTPATENEAIYDNLPIIDGLRFSDENTEAGIYFGEGSILSVCRDSDELFVKMTVDNKIIKLFASPEKINIECAEDFKLNFKLSQNCKTVTSFDENGINYSHNSHNYRLEADVGHFENGCFVSDNNKLTFLLK